MMKFIIVCMMCNSDECFVSDGFIKCDYCKNKQKIENGDFQMTNDEEILKKRGIIDDGTTWEYSTLIDMMAVARYDERKKLVSAIDEVMRRLKENVIV